MHVDKVLKGEIPINESKKKKKKEKKETNRMHVMLI